MKQIISALNAIPVSELTYSEWIAVGMALKEEGYPCSVWDEWSHDDSRYHPGECEKKWEGFNGSGTPVKGGTIIQMAKDRGWTSASEDLDIPLSWDDTICFDGDETDDDQTEKVEQKPTQELIAYLEALFESDDIVGFVTNDVWQNNDGKWVPSKGVYYHTASELMRLLKKYPDDLGAAVGDWKPDTGAWIRFNPLDGKGVKNENVTKFRFALVESDTLSLSEQEELYRKHELPIAAMVYSGGKSIHAIVHIDARNADEYRSRVTKLYEYLEKNGISIDQQNRNPSRLSRMPGATRNGVEQKLLAINIGEPSWDAWSRRLITVEDNLPKIERMIQFKDERPPLPEELIKGVLRCGHKMLISGSSKAGKSFLLMELCAAIASGTPWLGFECKQGEVLYINLEIDRASCIDRICRIFNRHRIDLKYLENISIWNLRGYALPLDKLADILIERIRNEHYIAIVLDPIYKVITGDENNASEMGAFCNQFDKICTETGCSAIYCHHHSKGAQGMKKAMDRASGSGVFARDPDAQLDMIELELSDHIKNLVRERNETGWRMESSLREFKNFKPVNFWFDYPIHRLDTNGDLENSPAQGSSAAGQLKNSYKKSAEEAAESFRDAYNMLSTLNTPVTVKDMESYLNISDKTVYGRLKKMSDEFRLEKGCIYLVEKDDDKESSDTDTEQPADSPAEE